MTSKKAAPKEAYVWIWLPGAVDPVVAGLIEREDDRYVFNYGQSYLQRNNAIAIYDPELPLRRGAIFPNGMLTIAGCLRDGSPDAWGRRVVINRLFGAKGGNIDVDTLDELSYMLQSGSDRIGALDFQTSAKTFEARTGAVATLEELQSIAERVESGAPVTPELECALFHGTSLGGARPKAAIDAPEAKFIAKFSSSNDLINVVKAEFIAMRLAEHLGLTVAPVRLEKSAGKDVLLIERFDRVRTPAGWERKSMVSALTMLGLDEMTGRYASYEELAQIIRTRFTTPKASLRELFGRMAFNVLCGNNDDHARNHAAFWDGKKLSLTPAYDICPQRRTGREANQAMRIIGEHSASTLAVCLLAAPQFQLSAKAASELIEAQIRGVYAKFGEIAEEAELSSIDRKQLWRRTFLNPYAFEDAPQAIAALECDV
ncbi:type II toxin-antitoxin system HipA family toxin [Methylosinus sp. PW1]|uniref:type II toxin-antitoxin system HipA family toxin n=1 Tax=Methylosinus sp. PW1 TaxID=107636 RepID=UPI0005619535|nr:type II toxin-antitoxin system HipA family toxin [Methylosinus sp. PW1]